MLVWWKVDLNFALYLQVMIFTVILRQSQQVPRGWTTIQCLDLGCLLHGCSNKLSDFSPDITLHPSVSTAYAMPSQKSEVHFSNSHMWSQLWLREQQYLRFKLNFNLEMVFFGFWILASLTSECDITTFEEDSYQLSPNRSWARFNVGLNWTSVYKSKSLCQLSTSS